MRAVLAFAPRDPFARRRFAYKFPIRQKSSHFATECEILAVDLVRLLLSARDASGRFVIAWGLTHLLSVIARSSEIALLRLVVLRAEGLGCTSFLWIF
jgi:hypothetical protein